MPSSPTVTYNNYKKIQALKVNGRVVVQPNTWYTCPANKKAIARGWVQCTGRGAAAVANFVVGGDTLFKWTTTNYLADYTSNPWNLTTNNSGQLAKFEIELEAGDTIETTQDSGTNAEFNVFMEVTETEA